MLIWAILLASFVAGVTVMLKGSLKVSQRRQIVGVTARRVGAGMLLLPFVVLAMTYGVMMASHAFGNTSETAATHGMIAGVLLISLAAIFLAANAKEPSGNKIPESSFHFWYDLIIPVTVKSISLNLNRLHFRVGDLATFGVLALIEPAMYLQALIGPC